MPLLAIPFPAIDPVADRRSGHSRSAGMRSPTLRAWCSAGSICAGWCGAPGVAADAGAPSTISCSRSTLGVVLGGRLGYMLFYRPASTSRTRSRSSTSGRAACRSTAALLGVVAAICAVRLAPPACRSWRSPIWSALAAPIGLFLGRIANFINGELLGRATRCALGDGVPGRRAPAAPSEPALRGRPARGSLLFALMRASRCGRGRPAPSGRLTAALPDRLRDRAHARRAVPRAGCPARLPVRQPDDGPAAVAADGADRHRCWWSRSQPARRAPASSGLEAVLAAEIAARRPAVGRPLHGDGAGHPEARLLPAPRSARPRRRLRDRARDQPGRSARSSGCGSPGVVAISAARRRSGWSSSAPAAAR